jgi:type II secretory pathway pseudopilin PulG
MSFAANGRGWAGRMLFESLMIMLSILAALGVSQWQGARQDKKLAQQATASFDQELSANRARLRELIPYHEHIRDQLLALDSAGAVHSFADMGKIQGFHGFRPAFLLETAWRTAVATGALSKLDYHLVSRLSTTYTLQERIDEMNQATLPAMLSGAALADANAATTVRTAGTYLVDIVGLEHEVLDAYDHMVPALEPGHAAPGEAKQRDAGEAER